MKKNIIIVAVLSGIISWSCSKLETQNDDLKQSLTSSAADINKAMSKIAAGRAYEFLTVTDELKKSDETYNDSITLDLVAGIYDFKPDFHRPKYFYIPRLFEKTGTSEHMIVNLPEKLIFRPRYLHNNVASDTVLENNFTIEATDYKYLYTWFNKYDYRLSAGFELNSEDLGELQVKAAGSAGAGSYSSTKYNFTEGYSIDMSFESGDTILSSIALLKGEEILLKESSELVNGKDFRKREREYVLTIGDVDIRRSTGTDSIQVFLDGVLQQEAAVKIIDTVENNGSVFYKRDIQITFDDGTVTKLSTLIQPARATLKPLMSSMQSMSFTKNIVDYIAIGIYYHSKYQ